jgi:hypothetical protein
VAVDLVESLLVCRAIVAVWWVESRRLIYFCSFCGVPSEEEEGTKLAVVCCGGFESDADAFSRLCHGADVLMCGGYIEAGKVMGRVKHVQTF